VVKEPVTQQKEATNEELVEETNGPLEEEHPLEETVSEPIEIIEIEPIPEVIDFKSIFDS
jgi:hypothetical protein